MRKAGLRKILKITVGVLLIFFVSALIAGYRFISPKSDQQILRAFEDKELPTVVSVHGSSDAIVPYENSLYLEELLGDRFALVTLEEGNHALLWTHFEMIRDLLLKSLKK